MKKKILAILAATALVGCLAFTACSGSSSSTSEEASSDAVEASADSLYAYHTGLGLDWDVTEISAATCAQSEACHGGSWDAIVESTEDMFEGIGQISDGNPHDSHAASGYTCDNCHSLYGTSINQCNGCHNFDSPEGWIDKDPETTVYGIATEEPLN